MIKIEIDDAEINNDSACRNHVSGLYGPGAMLGWYLTLAGCIVSWTLHPHRKQEDAITADLLTFLMLPLAAAAQAISLARQYSEEWITIKGDSCCVEAALKADLANPRTCQARFAIEAPARVVFVFLNICVMLYAIPAVRRLKRGSAIIFAILSCLASQYYGGFSTITSQLTVICLLLAATTC